MSYPTLTAITADAIAKQLRDDRGVELFEDMCSFADGDEYPREYVEAASARSREEWRQEVARRRKSGAPADLYYLEAFMASRVHRDLRGLSMDMRQHFGFWRYLALFPYRWYLLLREEELKPQDYGGIRENQDGSKLHENTGPAYQLMLRTFLWGKVAFDADDPDPYRRATLVNDTGGAVTDIWHSHLVRIQMGQLGRMPHAFLDSVCSEPLANDVNSARRVEKRLTRMKHTVLFDVYSLGGARRLADEQKRHVTSQ